MVRYSPSLTDPPTTSSIAQSAEWITQFAFGTIATTIASLAIATLGFLLLSGKLAIRRTVTVFTGCFLLFGARAIAVSLTVTSAPEAQLQAEVVAYPAPLLVGARQAPASNNDPYGGAAVPSQ